MIFKKQLGKVMFTDGQFDQGLALNETSVYLHGTLVTHVQLFQLTLLDQSIKLQDKTARLCEIFYE